LLRQRTGAPDEAADAAAARLEIPAPAALREHLEVDQSFLAIDDVGMWIDQARRDDLAAKVADLGGSLGGRFSRAADPGDLAAGDADCAAAHQTEGRVAHHRGDRCVEEKQVEHRSAPGNADTGKAGKRAAAVHDDGTS